jgi:transcriptional regulator with PAS, ATPase and Fis domain
LVAPRVPVRPVAASESIAARSPAMRACLELVRKAQRSDATVLLLGETGTGKEVVARSIHAGGRRARGPFVAINCAAFPETLLESELFGHDRGAFTGASRARPGHFVQANGGTLFLDEIGELPAAMQVKLLRVIQERVIERLGSPRPIKVDVRIIAATNRNLEEAVANQTFREDLFYRLNVFPIVVPPLRERTEDIPELVSDFVAELSRSFGRTFTSISEDSIRALTTYHWPGNVRELRNIVERAIIASRGPELILPAPDSMSSPSAVSPAVYDLRYEQAPRPPTSGAPFGDRTRVSELRLDRDGGAPVRHVQFR